jgi:hypothetical protein
MGMFEVRISLTGKHGCDRAAKPGEKLYDRCKKLDCADCRTLDFVQQLRQYGGFTVGEATITHFAGSATEVVDDLLKNERVKGQF